MDLKKIIRTVPNYPREGILFYDITTLLKDRAAFKEAIDLFYQKFKKAKIDKVVAVDARGFIFGAPLAYLLGAGFVPVRKAGKLPAQTIKATYTLEYGQDELAMHQDAISPGEKILIVDDLLATGGTISAVADLVEKLGGQIVALAFLIELNFLKGREKIKKFRMTSFLEYNE